MNAEYMEPFCARGHRVTVRCLVGLVAIACVAGCSSGSSTSRGSPSISSTPRPPAATDDGIRALLARSLVLPSVGAGQACPVTPAQTHSPVAQPADALGPGRGPLYPISFYLGQEATLRLSGQTPGPDGLYAKKVVWASTTGEYEGPVVVRVGRIDGAGRGHVRLSYDPGASRGTAVVFVVGDTPADWPSFTYVSGPGCYAYQLDGRTFTQVIVFRVVA